MTILFKNVCSQQNFPITLIRIYSRSGLPQNPSCRINTFSLQSYSFIIYLNIILQMLQVYHATQAICKPQTKSNEAAQREIEEAMCRVKEAQNLISAAIDPVIGLLSKDKRRYVCDLSV